MTHKFCTIDLFLKKSIIISRFHKSQRSTFGRRRSVRGGGGGGQPRDAGAGRRGPHDGGHAHAQHRAGGEQAARPCFQQNLAVAGVEIEYVISCA